MGYKKISIKLPTDYSEEQLKRKIEKETGIRDFSFQIERKSIDARKKSDIHWRIRIGVLSDEIKDGNPEKAPSLNIPYKKRDEKAVIVGSGPAGFFSAFVLQKAGFHTTLVERGSEVSIRETSIKEFESTGIFNSKNNYAFGEGGAGTFSDGKLTSRTKKISGEKDFVLSSYVGAGAPSEINYMAHPHLGSDNLKNIVKNLRKAYLAIGGNLLFETLLTDLKIKNGKVVEAVTDAGGIDADYFIVATGHSAHETYRMMIKRGVMFRTKDFAIGSRVEHSQEIINMAQWGQKSLPGVKAAEYRLTSRGDGSLPVYTFCMCPGGIVVPSSAYKNTNIVNGMSRYRRNGEFANAACVTGISLDRFLRKETEPLEALDWLGNLEESFYHYSKGYTAPFCSISDFIDKKIPKKTVATSYPMGLKPAALWELLPKEIDDSLREGLKSFCRKIKGFDTGNIMGLESKTSSPVQVIREKNLLCSGFKNLYIAGEGSGYSGGIISSASHGIKIAMNIIDGNVFKQKISSDGSSTFT